MAIAFNENRNQYEEKVSILIRKGERIPCEVTESFYTIAEDQRAVKCKVTESTSAETDPRFVRVIWDGELPLPPGRPEGQEIQVTFGFDDSQMMICRFRDVESGEEKSVNLSMAGRSGDDKNKVDKFLVE